MLDRPEEIIAGMTEGVLVFGPDGACEYANRAVVSILRFDPAGTNAGDTGPVTASSVHDDVLDALKRHGAAGGRDLVMDRSASGDRWYWMTVAPAAEDGRRVVTLVDVGSLLSGSTELARVVSTLRHDLRSPLTSIVGAAELMRTERLGEMAPPYRRMVGIVEESANRIEEILCEAKIRYTGAEASGGEVDDEQGPTSDR